MKQINANAPTPDEIMELAKENERLERRLNRMTKQMVSWRKAAIGWREDYRKLENSLPKFAIEQQIKALEEFKKECGMFVPVHKLEGRIEQLRNLIDSDKT